MRRCKCKWKKTLQDQQPLVWANFWMKRFRSWSESAPPKRKTSSKPEFKSSTQPKSLGAARYPLPQPPLFLPFVCVPDFPPAFWAALPKPCPFPPFPPLCFPLLQPLPQIQIVQTCNTWLIRGNVSPSCWIGLSIFHCLWLPSLLTWKRSDVGATTAAKSQDICKIIIWEVPRDLSDFFTFQSFWSEATVEEVHLQHEQKYRNSDHPHLGL